MTPPRTTPHALAKADEYRTYIGVDPGLDGGLAVVGNNSIMSAWVCATPTVPAAKGRRDFDRARIVTMLSAFTNRYAAIELVDAAPMRGRRQGTMGMFSFGRGYGLWLGIFEALGIPYIEVRPRAWKKVVLRGLGTDKAAAIQYVKRFHPTTNLRATPRCRTDHTGIADAVCLADYAKQTWKIRELLAKEGAL
jgi:hypothetical protein